MNNRRSHKQVAGTPHWTARLAVYGLSFLLASQPLMVSAQTIVAGTTVTTQTTAANGVPVINIATPSAKGVSHNQFQQYNIDQQGLVLNNAKAGTITQLGGAINANPHLRNSNAASLIINEVIAPNRSQLNGYSEVAGAAANVVIANPYGISCNGCGFINTPRATLTTGTINLHNGELTGFTVNGGQINIEGQGLNADNISQFDIISRAVTVNADIHAQKLTIVAGRNQIDYATLNATKLNSAASTTVDFALDSSVLGGMYANSIRLIGTEAGVGVRTLGNLATDSGDLTLSADGKISVNKSQSAHNLTLISANNEIELNDRVHSNNVIELQSQTTVSNNAAVTAGQNINVTATNLEQQGTIASGVTVQGQNYQITQVGDLTLNISNTITNKGKLLSGGYTNITTNTLNNQNTALIHSGQTLNINADQLHNQKDISSVDKLTVQLSDTLTNSGSIESSANLAIDVAILTNNQGTISAVGTADSHITATAALNNNQGTIAANAGTLSLSGQTISNDSGQLLHSGDGALRLISSGIISNRNGNLASNNTLAIVSGTNKDQAFDNTTGIVAANEIKIESGDVSNQGGTIEGNTLELMTNGDLHNGSDAQLNTGFISALSTNDDSLKLNVQGQFNNSTGTTQTNAQSATITANSLSNNGNLIHAGNGTFNINSTNTIDNTAGTILSNGTLNLAASELNNTAGEVRTDGGDLNLTLAGDLSNTSGLIEAGEALAISADNLSNVDGHIKSIGTQDASISTTGQLDNNLGFIESNADNLTLSGNNFSNVNGHITHGGTGALLLNVGASIDNSQGNIASAGDFSQVGFTQFINTNGALINARTVSLVGDTIDNSNSEIVAGDIYIGVETLNNTDGIISSQNYLSIGGITNLINTGGWLQSSDTLDLTVYADFTHEGNINALNYVGITADNIFIDTTSLEVDGDLNLTAWGDITNYASISSNQRLSINGGNLDNNGSINADLSVDLSLSNIVNNFEIGSYQNINIWAQLENYGGIAAGNDLEISGDIDNYGALFSGNDSRLYAYNLYNHEGANIFSWNNLTIADYDYYGSNTIIKSNSLINHAGTIEAFNGDILIKTRTLENKTDLPTITSTRQVTNSNLIYHPQIGGAIYTGSVGMTQAQGYPVLQASQPDALAIFETYGSNAAWNSFWTRGGSKRVKWFDVNVTRTRQQADLNITNPANLVAGNNLIIEADDITNQLSLIGAEGDIHMTGNNLSNVAFSLTDTITGNWRLGREKKRRAVPRSEPSQNNYYEQAGSINTSTVIGTINSTIQAGGSLTGDFTHRIDNQNIKQNTAGLTHTEQFGMGGGGFGTGLTAITPQGVATISGSTTPAVLNGNLAALTPVSLQTPTFTLPTGSGLFVVNTQPNHPYLIETNPTFLSNTNFTNNLTSTNHLFTGLGLQADQFTQRLGDGFYESRLLRDAIFAQTGRRYLTGQSNDQAQFKYLMDNAISARDSLNLVLGVALNAEQVARLTHDIVWLVEQNVQGHSVLVPRFYAATLNANDLNGQGALLVASTVELTGQGITNTGTIESDTNLQLTSNSDLLNRGTLKSGTNIELVARNNLFNTGGSIFAKGDIVLVASQGNIDIGRYTEQLTSTIDGRLQLTDTSTWVGDASTIQAGGTIDLHAGSDINIAGSTINADKSINANAGNNLNIQTVATTTDVHGQSANGRFSVDFKATTLDQLASQIQAGEDINLTAEEHIAIIGSTVTAAGDTNLNAGSDIQIAAAQQTSSYNYDSKSGGRTTKIEDRSTTHQQATIDAENININSGRDIAITGSDVNASNDINLQAHDNITLASVENSEYHYYFHKAKKDFGRKKSETLETEQIRNLASSLNAGNDVLINVTKTEEDAETNTVLSLNTQANDVHIIASDINAGNDIVIYAGDNLSAQTSTDYDYRFHEKTKTGLFGLTGSSESTTTKATRQQQANVKSEHDISLNAGNNIALISPTLDANNNIDIQADNQILLGTSKDSDYYHYEYSKTGAFKWEFGNEGHYDETVRHTEITAGGNINIDAGNGTIIEYKQNGTLEQSINTLSQLPELAWMKDIQTQHNDTVQWQAIIEEHDKWQEHESGIGGPGVTLIAIAVAIAMPTFGADFLGYTGELTAIEAAQVAVIESLANQATVSLITNGGDISAVFEDLLSKEGLLNLATAGATAGITNSLYTKLGLSTEAINLNDSLVANGAGLTLAENLQRNIIRAAVQSSVNTVAYGGDFEKNLFKAAANATVNTLAVQLTKDIGNLELTDGNISEGGLTKILAHAAVGCAAQSLTGGNCSAGALGAATAELLAPHLSNSSLNNVSSELSVLLATGIAALVTGEDLEQTINAGLQVERFNRQLHAGEIALAKKNAKLLQAAAAKRGEVISISEAEARIEKQLLRWVDADSNDGKVDELVISIIGFKGGNSDFDWDYKNYASLNPEQYTDSSINSENIPYYASELPVSEFGLTPEQIKERNDTLAAKVAKIGAFVVGVGSGAEIGIVLVRSASTLAAAAKVSIVTCLANIYLCGTQASIATGEIALGDAIGAASVLGTGAVATEKVGSKLIDELVEAGRKLKNDNAFDIIDTFRNHKQGMSELIDHIPVQGDKVGTVAVIDVNGQRTFGVNSTALVNDVDKNLARSWRERLGLNKGDAQALFHAEAHSLMRAYQKSDGKLPANVTMYSDRQTCSFCQKNIPALMKEMNIDKLTIFFKNGASMILRANN